MMSTLRPPTSYSSLYAAVACLGLLIVFGMMLTQKTELNQSQHTHNTTTTHHHNHTQHHTHDNMIQNMVVSHNDDNNDDDHVDEPTHKNIQGDKEFFSLLLDCQWL